MRVWRCKHRLEGALGPRLGQQLHMHDSPGGGQPRHRRADRKHLRAAEGISLQFSRDSLAASGAEECGGGGCASCARSIMCGLCVRRASCPAPKSRVTVERSTHSERDTVPMYRLPSLTVSVSSQLAPSPHGMGGGGGAGGSASQRSPGVSCARREGAEARENVEKGRRRGAHDMRAESRGGGFVCAWRARYSPAWLPRRRKSILPVLPSKVGLRRSTPADQSGEKEARG